MKHKEVIELYKAIKTISGHKGEGFSHKIARNRKNLQTCVEVLNVRREEIESLLKDYNREIEDIPLSLATREQNGEFKKLNIRFVNNESYTFDYHYSEENSLKKDQKLSEINLKYKEILKEYKEKLDEYTNFLNTEESEFVPIMIDKNCVPGTLTEEECFKIIDLISE